MTFELTGVLPSGWRSTFPLAWQPLGECGQYLNRWKPELAGIPESDKDKRNLTIQSQHMMKLSHLIRGIIWWRSGVIVDAVIDNSRRSTSVRRRRRLLIGNSTLGGHVQLINVINRDYPLFPIWHLHGPPRHISLVNQEELRYEETVCIEAPRDLSRLTEATQG